LTKSSPSRYLSAVIPPTGIFIRCTTLTKKNNSYVYSKARQIGELTMIPFYLMGGLLLGFWMGGWIDQRFDTDPYLRAVFMVLGLISGARESWRIVRQFAESESGPN